jgi:repressor LexA
MPTRCHPAWVGAGAQPTPGFKSGETLDYHSLEWYGACRSMDQLTSAQARVLDAIRCRAEAGDAPPTYRELQAELGFRSTASIRDHLRALERKGFLTLGQGRFRSLRLNQQTVQSLRVPILGSIVAGHPTPTQQAPEGYLELPACWVRGDSFALRVVGDSMQEAGILPGDTALLRRDLVPRNGQVVCATVEGATTLKTLEVRPDGPWLVPANARYRPHKLGPDSILQGVLQLIVRQYGQGRGIRSPNVLPLETDGIEGTHGIRRVR